MTENKTLTINGREVSFADQKNLLEVIRSANIDIPTFCYHSELSVYGACRLCVVEVEGRGIVASCSIKPEPGMVVKTHTNDIREIRKTNIELILANHDKDCTTCAKSGSCQLQDISARLGISEISFKQNEIVHPIDDFSPSLVRDPNKCVLCGDCVRACSEIQGIGAIDFSHRGADVTVQPAFGKNLDKVECVYCGQCAAVCPTGALMPKSEIEQVWDAINDSETKVVAQIAPAVRVALGEKFGLKPGEATTGQIVAALRALGFDQVYDTSFAADLTVIEEANEFINRKLAGENLPQFTSCCPAWVKFAEQYYPSLLGNLSSCKSPQQMFGALARDVLPDVLQADNTKIKIVSIMPCTAKKFEARRPELERDGIKEVDNVLTTQELAKMIEEMGLQFNELEPESLDMPLGFKTGAGVIFGTSGGVTEAVLRYAAEKVTGVTLDNVEFADVRGLDGMREATIKLGDVEINLAVVHGLKNAAEIADQAVAGNCKYDIVEVMACPGGCIGGAGQPVAKNFAQRKCRSEGLYKIDRQLQLHKAQDNHIITETYEKNLGEIGGHKAHDLLHTEYFNRKRIDECDISLTEPTDVNTKRIEVKVCVGTGCFVMGSQELLNQLAVYVETNGLADKVDVQATFCLERCETAPNVQIEDTIYGNCTVATVVDELKKRLA